VYKLTVLGCRVRFKTQQELANRLGCSRSHLNEQIGLLSELMIIVNKGHGFVDLNPNVYWYGRMEHQIAYCSQHCRLVWRARDLPSLLCPWPLHDFPDIDGPIFFSWDDWEDDET
jgi:hypothetical protein